MKKILIMTLLVSCTILSCADNKNHMENFNDVIIDQSVLDSATVLVEDSTDYGFKILPDAFMLVYNDSLLIASNRARGYGVSLISIFDMKQRMHHLVNYIPYGSDVDEMVACGIKIVGDELFVHDSYITHRYCSVNLRRPLRPADELHLLSSGVDERGVDAIPYREGLLVENPQCYMDEENGIYNDVPRLLYYKRGKCLTAQKPVTYQVADVNIGADIHRSMSHERICFVSHFQPFVELYNDSLQLLQRISLQTNEKQAISVGSPQMTMRQKRVQDGARISAKIDETRRVVGASNSFHTFLCSAADENYIYLVYCGKMLGFDYHTFPAYILLINWDGRLVDSYRYNRWINAISPSSEKGRFYLTVYAEDDSRNADMKLVKVAPATDSSGRRWNAAKLAESINDSICGWRTFGRL